MLHITVLPVEHTHVQNDCYVKLLTYSRKTPQKQRLVCSQ